MLYCPTSPVRHLLLAAATSSSSFENDAPPNFPDRRRVRFAGTAQVILVRKRTKEEKHNAWYCQSDYQQFDEDRRNTLRHFYQHQMMWSSDRSTIDYCPIIDPDMTTGTNYNHSKMGLSGQYDDDTTMTLSGLEGHLMRETAMARKRMTRRHCYSVLQQQYYNHWYGIYDDGESLRRVSLYYSQNYGNYNSHSYGSCGNELHQQQEGYVQAALQRSILKML
jgi:hypothetical protein